MGARDYQLFAAQSVWNFWDSKEKGNPLILMPTGTGKSHVISELASSILHFYPQSRIQVITHVKELIQQNYNKFVEAWPTAPAGIYSAGLGRKDIHNSIVFAGIQSVAKKPHAFGHVDIVIVDEAHTISPADETNYKLYFAGLKKVNPNLVVIGLTATGWRLGHGKIHEGDGALFTHVCCDMTTIEAFNWFIAQGYLISLIPKKTELQLDVSGVHLRGGEFIQAELQNAVDKTDITTRALKEAIAKAGDRRKWLIFASGVEHAEHIAQILTELGIPCGVVHSKMSKEDRDEVLADHRTGRIRAISNANILTTGYDDPEIDLIIVLRPTASAVLWVQMLGRGTRPLWPERDGSNWDLWPIGAVESGRYNLETVDGRLMCIAEGPKQNCLVLDYAGNTRSLGPINDPVLPRKKGEKSGPAPVKLCEVCEMWNHASARFCAACGHEFTFAVKLKEAASTVALIKGDAPVVEIFKVTSLTYQAYQRPGKPRMLRVSYYCGLRKFDEYVCVEHEPGFPRRKAEKWLRERAPDPAWTGYKVDEILKYADFLRVPTHLQVWVNKTYPEIMSYDYTGTAFGTKEAVTEIPTASVLGNREVRVATVDELHDDDIPF